MSVAAVPAAVELLLASDEPAVRYLTRRGVLGEQWSGAHRRLVSLVEREVPAGEPHSVAAANTVLHWLTGLRAGGRL